MEFKENNGLEHSDVLCCINRIRLEFKVTLKDFGQFPLKVLIESDWNLKFLSLPPVTAAKSVLIESDWNLKVTAPVADLPKNHSINRIRLEFKVFIPSNSLVASLCINRIRLEFKGSGPSFYLLPEP